jgi:ABC-type sugar transport system ATPase subunit
MDDNKTLQSTGEASIVSSNGALLQMHDINKAYPGVQALARVDLDVRRSEIHGLVGKNGAGKSTLMGVMMGLVQPDSGYMEVDGQRFDNFNTQVMLDAGVAYVPQRVQLLDTLTVAENIQAGDMPKTRLGFVDWKQVYADSEERLQKLGINIDVRLGAETLGVAEQKMLTIAKALFSNARLIILDEPTAALPRKDIDMLFNFIRSLKKQDVAFVYISHHLEEVFEICDRVTIMRDGQIVATRDVAGLTSSELIQLMVGEDVEEYSRVSKAAEQEVFAIKNLTRRGAYENVSLSLRKGEVVGLSGLQGSGVGELARSLFGMSRLGIGQVTIDGKRLTARSPAEAFNQGVALLPQDRHRFGMVGSRPVRENVTYSVLDKITAALGIIPRSKERKITSEYIDKLGIVTPSQNQQTQLLSGGNQQKVVFARLAATQPTVLILHEPSQGVDVRAKVDIFNIIDNLSAQGVAILIISAEVRELIGLCDRILVMYDGRLTREFGKEKMDPHEIIKAIEGGVGHD